MKHGSMQMNEINQPEISIVKYSIKTDHHDG